MTNFTRSNSQPAPEQNKPSDSYQSRLDQILAQAGKNNPIAASQTKQAKPDQNKPGGESVCGTFIAGPSCPQDKLSQILTQAGQTPAQRAQSQTQAKQANQQAYVNNMLQGFMSALVQDPAKLLKCDIEFAGNAGANDDLYFKCYVDAKNNIFWDVFGSDISYIIPGSWDQYAVYQDYYRGIPDQAFRAELVNGIIHSDAVI